MPTPDELPAEDPAAPPTKAPRKASATQGAAPEPEAVSEAVPTPLGVPLRYTGSHPVIVMDLGGEVVPDQLVRVSEPLASALTARGDFQVESD